MVLEKSTVTKESDKKKSSSEPQGQSKAGAVLPASLDRSVHEFSLVPARMKMKLPLQGTNEVVEKLSVSSKDAIVGNDAIVTDIVEGVVQSVTELSVSEDRDKKPHAEAMPNSVQEQVGIINEVVEANPNSVPEQENPMNEVGTTGIDVCDVMAGNNVETSVVAINADYYFLA